MNFDVSDISCKIAGQIPTKDQDPEAGLDMDEWLEPREQKRVDRFIAYGIVSAIQAVEDSGWVPKSENQKLKLVAENSLKVGKTASAKLNFIISTVEKKICVLSQL